MKLNEKIFYLRKKEGYSQEALAEKLGVSRQAVSKWENGDADPEI
ncbi:helix-turn-helix transcriptional regulator, partial [Proteiniclasticum sp.]